MKSSELITPQEEKFQPKNLLILCSIHILALGAFIFPTWEGLSLLIVSHLFFSLFGISLGYHRYFSHKSFKAPVWFENFLGVVSTACFQGGPLYWACSHRMHHRFTEQRGDPHSAQRGFWWSHMGWLLYSRPNGFSYKAAQQLIPDLKENRVLVWLERNSTSFNFLIIAVLGVAFGSIGRLDLFLWAAPLRIVTVWHATWSINSFAHSALPFVSNSGKTKNIFLMDLLLGGEGTHRWHHTYPGRVKPRPGRAQLDLGYQVLRLLHYIGCIQIRRKPSDTYSLDRTSKNLTPLEVN